MKRQFESLEDSNSCDSSSSYDESNNKNTPKQTIRNNRSRRYVDNIVPQQVPPPNTTLLNPTNNNRNTSSQVEQGALSFPFVSSSTKVPTNRRHLKLRKQLKTCENFSSSYFVLDVNAPAANTIGFMGSTRGNDIPVLLTDTVSNNNQTQVANTVINPPPSKKAKRAKQTSNSTVTFVSNKKGGNKKWANTTIVSSSSNSPNHNNNNTNSPSSNNNTQYPITQSFQQPMMSSQMMNRLPNLQNIPTNQSTPNLSHQQIISQPMNSFQQDFNSIQSLLNPTPYQNVQNNQQNNTFQTSFESLMGCYTNPVMNSPPLGQISGYSSIDASPLTTPSTPSTNGIASPIIGSLLNAHQSMNQSMTNFGMPSQNYNVTNYNSDMVNQSNQQTVMLEDLLSKEEVRILFDVILSSQCYNNNNQF